MQSIHNRTHVLIAFRYGRRSIRHADTSCIAEADDEREEEEEEMGSPLRPFQRRHNTKRISRSTSSRRHVRPEAEVHALEEPRENVIHSKWSLFYVSCCYFVFLRFRHQMQGWDFTNVQTTSGSRSPLILNSKPPICINSGGLQPLRYHQNQKFELKGSGHYW